jgi:uncharacterized protein YecA (UPF0149 family)
MIRTQISLTEEQMNTLKTLSAEKGESIAELIRQAVEEMMRAKSFISREQRRQRALAAAGRFTSNDEGANVSRDHDAYLDEAYSTWQSS